MTFDRETQDEPPRSAPRQPLSPPPVSSRLERLVYVSDVSSPTHDLPMLLDDILAVARPNNLRQGMTGALALSGASFVQVLEGSPTALRGRFGRIQADPRHTNIQILAWRPVTARLFGGWSMASPAPDREALELKRLMSGSLTSAAYVTALLVRVVNDPSSGWVA